VTFVSYTSHDKYRVQVMRSLWGPDATEPLAPVDVKYRRLEKGAHRLA